MALINPGYLGVAKIGGNNIRCTGFSVNLTQEIEWYDHIVGLRDTPPKTLAFASLSGGPLPPSKGIISESTSPVGLQKTFFRPGVKIVQGEITFPLTDLINNNVFTFAKEATLFDFEFFYNCEDGRRFTDCRINSYSFSISAGDFAQISLNIMGIGLEDIPAPVGLLYTSSEKLITWDKVQVNFDDFNDFDDNMLQSFEFSIVNNVRPVYTSGFNQPAANDLKALALRVGMQSLTGLIIRYNKNASTADVTSPFNLIRLRYPSASSGIDQTLRVIYKPLEASGAIGIVTQVLSFEGIDHYFY